MRLRTDLILVLVLALLCTLLALVWLGPGLALGGPRWSPVQAIMPELALADGTAGGPTVAGAEDLGEILARPVFSPSRRPPLPAQAPNPAVAAEPLLEQMRLLGMVSAGEGHGAVVAELSGRVERLVIGARVGEWKLTGIDGREAEFTRSGGEVRKLRLLHAAGAAVAAAPAPAPSIRPADGLASQLIPTPAAATNANEALKDRIQREHRERMTARNALRIKNGLPPLPES